MNEILTGKQYLVLTGNYGSGKTELALNLAMHFSRECAILYKLFERQPMRP